MYFYLIRRGIESLIFLGHDIQGISVFQQPPTLLFLKYCSIKQCSHFYKWGKYHIVLLLPKAYKSTCKLQTPYLSTSTGV